MPSDPNLLHDLLLARLRQLPDIGGRVYDGEVPPNVSTVHGYVLPYVVVFGSLGSDLPEQRDLTRLTDTTVLDWQPQINVVGGSPAACRAATQQVRQLVTNLHLGGGWLMPDPDAFRFSQPIKDTEVSPARFYLPLQLQLLTT